METVKYQIRILKTDNEFDPDYVVDTTPDTFDKDVRANKLDQVHNYYLVRVIETNEVVRQISFLH